MPTTEIFEVRGFESIEEYAARAVAAAQAEGAPVKIVFNDDFQMEVQPETKAEEVIETFHEFREPLAISVALASLGRILSGIRNLKPTKVHELAGELQQLSSKFFPHE